MDLLNLLKRVFSHEQRITLKNTWDYLIFNSKISKGNPLLIYQMGKVGSSSIYYSLKSNYKGLILHLHSFPSKYNYANVKRLRNFVVKKKIEQVNIISLVREPIDRNISAFFQNFERYTGTAYAEAKFSIEELLDIFLLNFNHNDTFSWFDDNILKNFGLDVFGTPFPEEGFCSYYGDNFNLLILKVEIEDELKEEIISKFLKLEKFKLSRYNVGKVKDYAQTYKKFKDEIILPLYYIDLMCESKYIKHFYNSKEIEIVREKWLSRIANN